MYSMNVTVNYSIHCMHCSCTVINAVDLQFTYLSEVFVKIHVCELSKILT